MENNKCSLVPTVLYILGAGGSGSTLLSMVLGAHSQIISVGELSRIDQYRVLDLTCSCGKKLSHCEFWSSSKDSSGLGYPAPLTPTNTLYNLFWYRSDCLRLDPHYLSVVKRNLDLYRQLVEISDKPIIVDASKDLLRFFYLYRSGHIRLIPLHLVRDGRAYIDSMRRRQKMTAVRATLRWVRINLMTQLLLKRLRINNWTLTVDYDNFTCEPEACIKKICSRLEVDYESEMLNYHDQSFHNIAGTLTRFSPRSIIPQHNWQARLSKSDCLTFRLLGGHQFNRYFGIHSN